MFVRENSHTELQEDKHWTFYCLLHGFVSFFLSVRVCACMGFGGRISRKRLKTQT